MANENIEEEMARLYGEELIKAALGMEIPMCMLAKAYEITEAFSEYMNMVQDKGPKTAVDALMCTLIEMAVFGYGEHEVDFDTARKIKSAWLTTKDWIRNGGQEDGSGEHEGV